MRSAFTEVRTTNSNTPVKSAFITFPYGTLRTPTNRHLFQRPGRRALRCRLRLAPIINHRRSARRNHHAAPAAPAWLSVRVGTSLRWVRAARRVVQIRPKPLSARRHFGDHLGVWQRHRSVLCWSARHDKDGRTYRVEEG